MSPLVVVVIQSGERKHLRSVVGRTASGNLVSVSVHIGDAAIASDLRVNG
jgi:hypothetical protein